MKNNDKYGVGAEGDFSRLGASLMFLLVVCSCAMISAPAAASEEYMVKVLFNLDSSDKVVCPLPDVQNMRKQSGVWQPVSGDLKLTSDKDTIFWQAYNKATNTTLPYTYKVFFDPFKGPSAEAGSGKNGKTKVLRTKKKSEIPTGVFFKYTIWADVCPDNPKDPRFKVQ